MMDNRIYNLMSFLDASPSVYHAVANLETELKNAGYTPLFEGESWNLIPGGKYSDLALVNAAHRLGLYVITAGTHKDAPAHKFATATAILWPTRSVKCTLKTSVTSCVAKFMKTSQLSIL